MLNEPLLAEARRARDRILELQHGAEQAQVDYQHAIRRLHASGASLREIAESLGVSYQRIHQIVDVSTGKGALKRRARAGPCAFCGSGKDDVSALIAGPGIFICDRCVALAHEALASRVRPVGESAAITAVGPDAGKLRCGFCGRRRERIGAMVQAPLRRAVGKFAKPQQGPQICGECLELCDEILASGGR